MQKCAPCSMKPGTSTHAVTRHQRLLERHMRWAGSEQAARDGS